MLQTHTAGLRDFDVQYRIDSGSWRTLRNDTTTRSLTLTDRVSRTDVRVARAGDRPSWQCGAMDRREEDLGSLTRHPFEAVNLISDPIHGYIELTKRLTPAAAGAIGLPDEDLAEQDILDTAWLQRLRRISQLQSARWVFPTAEHSRFTHGLGVMHEAGHLGAIALPEPAVGAGRGGAERAPCRPRDWSSRPCGWPDCSTTSGHGPFAHFFDDHVLADFEAPPIHAAARASGCPTRTSASGSSRTNWVRCCAACVERQARHRSATPSPTASRSIRAGSPS